MGTTGVTLAYEHRATEVGITEADIRELIPAFYAKVRYDSILGPVFEGIIGDNWATHIETVCSFWLHVTRLDRHYQRAEFHACAPQAAHDSGRASAEMAGAVSRYRL